MEMVDVELDVLCRYNTAPLSFNIINGKQDHIMGCFTNKCKMKNDNEESRDSVMQFCCFFSSKRQLF